MHLVKRDAYKTTCRGVGELQSETIDISRTTETVSIGSLVITDSGKYFIAVGKIQR